MEELINRKLTNIAFIGVGIMGSHMVCNLLKKGFKVNIFARNKNKVKNIINQGAIFFNSISDCVKNCDAVITIVGYPNDVEEIYFSKNAIINSANEGTYLIDMTTTSPFLSSKIFEIAKQKNLKALDAPVSGGDIGAKNASLSIMVGGNKKDFDACKDIFESLGKTIVYQGKAGNGQHAKMANQIAIAGTIAGVAEAIAYAHQNCLDVEKLLESISSGAAQSFQLSHNALKMHNKDYEPGFYIKHIIKDLNIAKEESKDLIILKEIIKIYETLESQGFGKLGTQAISKFYE